jgi:hypothetical protein
MSSLSLAQSFLWTVTWWVPIVSLFKDKIEQGWVNSCAVIKVRSFCCTRGTHRVTVQRQDWLSLVQSCLWTVTRCVPLVQPNLLTFIRVHEFTQPCSILSLLFKDKIEQGWVNSCAVMKVRSFRNFLPLSEHMSSLSLVQSCLWTVTRWVPLVQQKLLTFITAHEFTQPCSILLHEGHPSCHCSKTRLNKAEWTDVLW